MTNQVRDAIVERAEEIRALGPSNEALGRLDDQAAKVLRESGAIRLEVVESAGSEELGEVVAGSCLSGTTVNTDEWAGYSRVGGRHGRVHARVDHSGPRSTWAIDADGDGVREVHVNTQEGLWPGLRNLLRTFRGVSKKYLYQYVAIFEWGYNIKRVTPQFIRAVLGLPITTFRPP